MENIVQDSINAIAKQCIIDQLDSSNNIKKISEICSVIQNNIIDERNDATFTRNDRHIYIYIEESNVSIVPESAFNMPCHYTLILNDYSEQLHKYVFNYLTIASVYAFIDLDSVLSFTIALSDEAEDNRIHRLETVNGCIDNLLELW